MWLAGGGCGWNLWVWLVGVFVRRHIYRFPHITYPYSSCICSFLQQHPTFCSFIKMFFVLYTNTVFTLGKCNVLVRFGTVINYSVNCCTTVPYRTEPYAVGSLTSVGLVWYGTVRYSTLGNGSVNSFLIVHIQISPCLHPQGPYSWARYVYSKLKLSR